MPAGRLPAMAGQLLDSSDRLDDLGGCFEPGRLQVFVIGGHAMKVSNDGLGRKGGSTDCDDSAALS
ncbi:MAG: hypothetical protein AB7V43_02300 [Acidimicrobiia bacterium]